MKCNDQDMRNLRCYQGETSLGEKAIIKCSICYSIYNSNELATIEVDKHLKYEPPMIDDVRDDFFDGNGLWFKGSINSKRQALLELSVMRAFVKQKKQCSNIARMTA